VLRRVVLVALGAGVLGAAAVAALNLYVVVRASAQTGDVARVPHAQAAIVLGAGVHPSGWMSRMLRDRETLAQGARVPGENSPEAPSRDAW